MEVWEKFAFPPPQNLISSELWGKRASSEDGEGSNTAWEDASVTLYIAGDSFPESFAHLFIALLFEMKFFSPPSRLRCERTFSSMSSPKLTLGKLARRSPPAWLGSCSVGWESNQVSQAPGDLGGGGRRGDSFWVKSLFQQQQFMIIKSLCLTSMLKTSCWNPTLSIDSI